MPQHDDSDYVFKGPCNDCGSSDACAVYSDGHRYCFSCQKYTPSPDEGVEGAEPDSGGPRRNTGELLRGETSALPTRGITLDTCRKWGYQVGNLSGTPCQIANYRDRQGRTVAQKARFADKSFSILGDAKAMGLYGSHLWRDHSKRIVITEGEIDALSVSQAQGNRWPVVSVPNGAQSAASHIADELDWLLGFDEIVLFFDNDDPGQAAVLECATKFPPGRVKVAKMAEYKDPNEALQDKNPKAITDAIWEAKEWRPDGIVSIDDILDEILTPPEMGRAWWSKELTELTYGRRLGEIYAFGAGTGIGKTDFFTQQMLHDIYVEEQKIAVFALEQRPAETVKRLAGKLDAERYHVPPEKAGWDVEKFKETVYKLRDGDGIRLYDNFGATDWDIIKTTIRHLKHSEGIELFYLDHLTALAAAEENEREGLEHIMAEMASLTQELHITIHFISHLATPEGKPHEEGGRVMIRHFKGSRAIGFWCDYMFGMERNQQAEEEHLRHVTTFRVLKDRYTGLATGECIYLGYDHDTCMMQELGFNPHENEEIIEAFGANGSKQAEEAAF